MWLLEGALLRSCHGDCIPVVNILATSPRSIPLTRPVQVHLSWPWCHGNAHTHVHREGAQLHHSRLPCDPRLLARRETVPGQWGRSVRGNWCRPLQHCYMVQVRWSTVYSASVCFRYLKVFQGSPHHLFENFHGSTHRHLEEIHNEEKLPAGMIHYSIVDAPEQSFIGELQRREGRSQATEQEGNCAVEKGSLSTKQEGNGVLQQWSHVIEVHAWWHRCTRLLAHHCYTPKACTNLLLRLLCLGYDNNGVFQLSGDDCVSVAQGEYCGAVLERSSAGEEAWWDIASRSTTKVQPLRSKEHTYVVHECVCKVTCA